MTLRPIGKSPEQIRREQAYLSYAGGKPASSLVMRMATSASADTTATAKKRSKTIVLATEEPVKRWDEFRGMEVGEILLMAGIEFRRPDKKQLPIVDSGDVSTVRNIYGSIRNLRVDGSKLVGTVYWASDRVSQDIARKWEEGHLDDFQVTAAQREITTVLRDQKWKGIQGPLNVVTKWIPLDASIFVSGAPDSR